MKYVINVLSEKWHCPPSVVRAQSAQDLVDALVMMSAEGEVQQAKGR